MTALIDSAGPAALPAWEVPAEIALTLLGGAAGWWLSGPLPPAPGARTAPPPGVPLLPLAPAQRAVYAVSAWHPRSPVPYDQVLFASVRPRTSGMRTGGMIGGSRGWGYVSGRGPVLALRLTDGREFLYSTRDAETAAALVNASLARARGGAGC
ncbi:hypothetical protein [Microbispora sp. CA-102843]|uniref:hypothetical protein n=1 Tax=Microbispora sp. CA-102843 TaxID=3239952 RepID=UPI003D8DC7E2